VAFIKIGQGFLHVGIRITNVHVDLILGDGMRRVYSQRLVAGVRRRLAKVPRRGCQHCVRILQMENVWNQ